MTRGTVRQLAFGFVLLFWLAVFFMARSALAEESPGSDIPREAPLSATGFVACETEHPGRELVVAVVVTYAHGQFVRFDLEHMHGMPSAQALIDYAGHARDQKVYTFGCFLKGGAST